MVIAARTQDSRDIRITQISNESMTNVLLWPCDEFPGLCLIKIRAVLMRDAREAECKVEAFGSLCHMQTPQLAASWRGFNDDT
jgi:hypothetical protein